MKPEDLFCPMLDLEFTPQALDALPNEYTEAVCVDLTTRDGKVVLIPGRVTVIHAPYRSDGVVFVDVPVSISALDRYSASALIQNAVRDRLVGSDVVKAAVDRGYEVKGLAKPCARIGGAA